VIKVGTTTLNYLYITELHWLLFDASENNRFAANTNISIVMSGMVNPTFVLTGGVQFKAFVVKERVLIEDITYPNCDEL